MSGSCDSANFVEDCFAKYYLVNPNGGGIAYIGNSDWGLTSDTRQLTPVLSSLFNNGTYASNRFDIGNAFHSIINSGVITKKWHPQLLSDPEVQVWTAKPATLSPILSTTAVCVGTQTVNVTITGLPTDITGRICFWKGDEVYVIKENVINGTYFNC